MKKLLLFAEHCFVVFALLNFTGAWIPLLYEIVSGMSAADANQGILAIQLPFYAIYGLTLLLIVLRWKKVVYATSKDKLLLFLIGIALASIFWSEAPSITLRRSVALTGTTLFGVYFATRYSLKEQLHMLAWALGIAAVSSFVLSLAFPTYGIMHEVHVGGWRGVYIQKNVLGLMMVLSTLVFLLIAISSSKYRYLTWTGFGLSVGLILLSTSKSSLVLILTLLVLLPLYRVLRWNPSRMLLFFISVAIAFGSIATSIFSNLNTVLGALGRDATLTGRTNIWAAVLDMIWQRPWLGYGYSGFWLGLEGKSAYVWYAIHWTAPHSHNGFLDLWVELGLLGLLVYVISFLICCYRAVTLARATKTSHGLWSLMFLTLAFLSNFSESTILKQNHIFWVLYVAVALSTAIEMQKPKTIAIAQKLRVKNV